MIRLCDVLEGLNYKVASGNDKILINKIEYDSRKVKTGDVFVCVTGYKTDGHKYAEKAVKLGASALICERLPAGELNGAAVIILDDTRIALSYIAANYYKNPSKRMKLVGVTGTNGKTTTTYLIKSILDLAGNKVGVIGTIGNVIGERKLKAERTTPEALELMELFSEMESEGVSHVAMEVSSHSLDLHRVDTCCFDVAVFTNITQDHLDFHKSMEEYISAKAKLFSMSKACAVNADDPVSGVMSEKCPGKTITYGIENPADIKAENIRLAPHNSSFSVLYMGKRFEASVNTPGKFSVYNALSAISACVLLGIPMDTITEGLKKIPGVSGRFQSVTSAKGVTAVIDYSHTPDSLENALKTAKEFVKGKIIVVFGCGGDRDKTKRPVMGKIAGKLADFCIITSDNPRSEIPETIIDDIEAGTKETGTPYIKITDRYEAIEHAVKIAQNGDFVLIAGKGHETYQEFADKTIHFDDMEIVKNLFGEDVI